MLINLILGTGGGMTFSKSNSFRLEFMERDLLDLVPKFPTKTLLIP